jgi:hypothetical protein
MNWKRFGRKGSWTNCRVLTRYSPGITEENKEKNSVGYPVAGVKYRIRDLPNTTQEC